MHHHADSEVLAIIREHSSDIITQAESARRAGVSRVTVGVWINKHIELSVLAEIFTYGISLIWWPGMKVWLDAVNRPYGEPAECDSHTCMLCGELIARGVLEVPAAGEEDNTHQFFHFLHDDCAAGRQQPAKYRVNTGIQRPAKRG